MLENQGYKTASTKISPRINPRLYQSVVNKKRVPRLQNEIKKRIKDLVAPDLITISKALKKPGLTVLCLINNNNGLQKRYKDNESFGFLGFRHTDTLLTFCRALAWAISSGCLQELELGFCLWERDLKVLAESVCQTTTLKRLSFSNSDLGNQKLQILGRGLQECSTLEVLNLSNCALTDAVAPLLCSILKANVCRKTQADWQGSIRNNNKGSAIPKPKIHGLVALDLSYNKLSDVSTQLLCGVLRVGAPLKALNLRGNQLTLISGKVLLDVMIEMKVLHMVDLRDNLDDNLMCVLEEGEHCTKFSRPCAPFWCSSSTVEKHRKNRLKKKLSKKAEVPIPYESVETKGKQGSIDASKVISRVRPASSSVPLNSNSSSEKARSVVRNAGEATWRRPPIPRKSRVLQLGNRNTISSGGSSTCRQSSLEVNHSSPSVEASPSIQNHQSSSSSLRSTPEIHGWDHGDESDCGGHLLANAHMQ